MVRLADAHEEDDAALDVSKEQVAQAQIFFFSTQAGRSITADGSEVPIPGAKFTWHSHSPSVTKSVPTNSKRRKSAKATTSHEDARPQIPLENPGPNRFTGSVDTDSVSRRSRVEGLHNAALAHQI